MYFPHLLARKEELLALRGLCELPELGKTTIPILEAVSENSGNLKKCLVSLGEAKIRTIIITNPSQGDFKEESPKTWEATLAKEFEDHPSLLPGFRCRPNSKLSEVKSFLKKYVNKQVALIYWNPKFTNEELKELISEPRVKYHVNVHDKLSKVQRALLPSSKAVDVIERFNLQDRNADYSGTEFFSDHHTSYKNDGVGYGDFSVTGHKYVKGGGQAHAVAIHMMFHPSGSDELHVEHFVSDDTDPDVGTVSTKYLQAASKAVAAAKKRAKEFGSSTALAGFAEDVKNQHSSGLGMSKRRQISHHIETMHVWLSNDRGS